MEGVKARFFLAVFVDILVRNAEGFQGFVFRRGCKRKITGVFEHLAAFDNVIDQILVRNIALRRAAGR